jgi:hypothetical protein
LCHINLTQNSVAFTPVSADALQIQIDGVIQSGNYTVANATVTFDFTPSGSSVCNGIKHFGVGVLSTPSDGSVNMAQLGASGTKSSSTFLAGDNSFKTVSGTTINNNADNRVITGSGTANTLEGEANLTFDGNDLTLGNGNIVFGTASKGVYLGVTSATASNLLDDYEFGDFTPTWTAVGSGSISATPTNFAKYVKSGRQVTVSVSTIFQTSGTFTDYKITNLPFTQSMIGAGTGVEYGQVGCGLMIQGVNNSTNFLVKKYDGGFIANAYMMLSYTYITTA